MGEGTSDDIPADLLREIRRLTQALGQDVGVSVTSTRAMTGVLAATLKDGVLVIPAQHVAHWKRFGVIPSALVRDVAYACKREQLVRHGGVPKSHIEADAMAYAERFLRAATDSDED